ncbi:MAG TPA: hydantoinase/oxoprolinase family protein [Candidatus Binatia bacterium]|nr:hydantoinase/oxoprolinase family protein [Candidatus Binatia bacterium]
MSYAIAVDIGGTFTDLVAFNSETQEVLYSKSPTTYDNLVDGIIDCFNKAKIKPREGSLVNHGTTLVINSLIQRQGAKTALITSKGFRDVLEIARANRPDPFDLHYQRDEPLISRELRFEVAERMGSKGDVVTPLDVSGVEKLASEIRNLGVESVAIFFMNSYINPVHEEAAAESLKKLLPGVYVTFSTDLTREWYEYERCSTVAANAYVGPQVSTYVGRLDGELKQQGFTGSLFMMGSNGGLLSAERSCRQPIGLVESGPIGGCIGAAAYAEKLGFKNVVAFDMGGTTAKCALVENGRFSVNSVYYANGYVKGFPIKSAVIDIVEVGSGGGSIAWLDSQKRLHVGPRSAGSTPGPVCYSRGGLEPTVTDANLALGRLNPANFLGGEMKLDKSAAENAVVERVAAPLGYTGEKGMIQMADGILSIATVMMAGAIRKISVEHGLDPRDFVLFSYGGGGPLHCGALAHELSIPTVVIPPEPGNFSAIGMLLADARIDSAKTFVGLLDDKSVPTMAQAFTTLEKEAAASLAREFGSGDVFFERFAEMRYRGQRHNIKVPVSGLSGKEAIRTAFERDYKRRYGHADAKAPAEFQALHLSAFARLKQPDVARLPRAVVEADSGQRRKVYMGNAGGWLDTMIFRRDALKPGLSAAGPAIIEEYGSTTLVWPGDRFEIGALGEIRIDCAAK